ncbi:sugar O-acetyltransferase [Aliikangiella sp. G2MR2-5]|uniref:sugar O-acetyltransferase n=1 Tax=Aliikangiella sp. G2MR2-5 TaxID=2788943 RepID=UPI0018AA9B93|nr:sugar O-acetyltransferase [Aliikangiella sp. G2MR2-5]
MNTIEFDSLTSERREKRNLCKDICRQYARAPGKGNQAKVKKLLGECGHEVFIEPGFHCDYGDSIFIGNRVFINLNCTFIDGGNIIIGDDTLIGPNVQILTINHPLLPEERLRKTNLAKDVVIGKNVWIGAGAIILPGVNIDDGCTIGAGAIVTRSTEGCGVYLGNPARKKPLSDHCP